MIFGNSDIRLKTGTNTIFSNIGIYNSYYDSKADKVDMIFGEG